LDELREDLELAGFMEPVLARNGQVMNSTVIAHKGSAD
jgi:hypothetical protein